MLARIDNAFEGLSKHNDTVGRKLDLLKNEQREIREELGKSDNINDRLRCCHEKLSYIDKQFGIENKQ